LKGWLIRQMKNKFFNKIKKFSNPSSFALLRRSSAFFRIISHQKGFSVVESLFIVVLAGILIAIAGPNINSLTDRYRLNGATRLVWGDLQNAKMTAIKTNQSIAVNFDTTTQYSFTRGDGTNFSRDLGKEYPSVTVSKSGGGNITFTSSGMTQNATVNVQGPTGNKSISLTWTGRVLLN
jgi:Tfp pilus assembly protein FimT